MTDSECEKKETCPHAFPGGRLWRLTFRDANGVIGSLISYSAQPELTPRHDDSQFNAEPKGWEPGQHFTGHELESLGRASGEIVRRELIRLLDS